MSRSFYATFHLDLQQAFQFHILGPLLYLTMLLVFFKFSIEIIGGRKTQLGKTLNLNHLCYIFALFLMLNWLYVLF
jgi:hypothetical protein